MEGTSQLIMYIQTRNLRSGISVYEMARIEHRINIFSEATRS